MAHTVLKKNADDYALTKLQLCMNWNLATVLSR
jgi:hypothetical protein